MGSTSDPSVRPPEVIMSSARMLTDLVEVLGPPTVIADPGEAGFDLVFPIAAGDRRPWRTKINTIFLTGVPRALRQGGRVYLKQSHDIFWSAPVEDVLSDSDPISYITGDQHADGPSMIVDLSAGRRHRIDARTLPTPDGRPWHDRRGIKYVSQDCREYVRIGPRPPKGAMRSRSSHEIALERALGKHVGVDRVARRLKIHDGALRPIVEVDICVPELRLVVEYDGSYWHRNRWKQDIRKTERLLAAGLRVVRVREGLADLPVGINVSAQVRQTPDDIARAVLDAAGVGR
jgi:very-short-patch-repair endonuclease